MDRVRRISEELALKFPGAFGTDYQENKEKLNQLTVIHSKMVRNKVAGYITKINGRAAREEEAEKSAE